MTGDDARKDAKFAKVFHGKGPAGVWVCWEWRRAPAVRLKLNVSPEGLVSWRYEGDPTGERGGAELAWQHGHLVATGPDGEAFFGWLGHLELQPQLVDAELRAATGYEEAPE